jgi:starch phosphorylase
MTIDGLQRRASYDGLQRRISIEDLPPRQGDIPHSLARRPHESHPQVAVTKPPKTEELAYLAKLMASYLSEDVDAICQFVTNHVEYTLARSAYNIDNFGLYQATSYSIKDRLIEFWNDTHSHFRTSKTKMVYYFSIEYLLGRHLQNAVMNLDIGEKYGDALRKLGFMLEDLFSEEIDPALGNGGLGRLAACFLDSLATLDYPAWGYGLRYNYGMFKQVIHQGEQIEAPDYWLSAGNPWEIERNDLMFPVRLYGHVTSYHNLTGDLKWKWEGGVTLLAKAYDTPIPGFSTFNTINLRLWSSVPNAAFDLAKFDKGDYSAALREKQECENLTSVLYPNDSTYEGKELRLKQQYFFACASLADIIARYKRRFPHLPMTSFNEYNAIQLNDTHPTVCIAEMFRVLLDLEGLGWTASAEIVFRTFAYTNHTVLPEALEEWPVHMFEHLLPRHLQIIYEINQRFLDGPVAKRWPGSQKVREELSIIRSNGHDAKIRMAYLAVVCCHSINGVAKIHTDLVQSALFPKFYELWPERFSNKTNGVTTRRWLMQCNKPLAALLTETLESDDWITEFELTSELRAFAKNEHFQRKFQNCKQIAKHALARVISAKCQVEVNPHALFDVHVKRIHEYKRQLLNILGVMSRYLEIKSMSPEQRKFKDVVPRVVIFAGKAAPGYLMAKNIIKLICSVANVVNNDLEINSLLKVVYLPNYNVSLAEVIIPAADISQHISTAGTEASGTSNMKFCMNGGLIVGTLDGANVEIREEIGEENMFHFGLTADQVPVARTMACEIDPRLATVIKSVKKFVWASEEKTNSSFLPLVHKIEEGTDFYLVARDFASYMDCQAKVDQTWRNRTLWAEMCINTTAGMGKFSSDRTIHEYAKEIWNVEPCRVPAAVDPIYHT